MIRHIDGRKIQLGKFGIKEKGINFNDMPTEFKRGVCCIKKNSTNVVTLEETAGPLERSCWIIDKEIPIFTQDRDYVERYVYCEGCARCQFI